jgi:2-dehydropantoate 2-reductase
MSVSLERRMAGAERVGGHSTPMLEDVARGRRLEIEPLLGTIIEMAGLVHVETPMLRLVYDLAKALDWRLQHDDRHAAEVASLPVQSARG